MMNFIAEYWYLLLGAFILGAILYEINRDKLNRLFGKILNRAPLIKKYWLFTIPFFIAVFIIFYCIIQFCNTSEKGVYISLVGQMATLIFAAYAAYLAFQQLMESRLDKLREYGDSYLIEKQYRRAAGYYLDILKIKSKDYRALSNVLEIDLLDSSFEKFDKEISLLKDAALEDSEKLICKYLEAARYLLDERGSEARKRVKEVIFYIDKNPSALDYLRWNFRDLKESKSQNTPAKGGGLMSVTA